MGRLGTFWGLIFGAFSATLDVFLGVGRIASQASQYGRIYGRLGLFIPLVASSDVWRVVNEVLHSEDKDVVKSFVEAQVRMSNMVGVTVGTFFKPTLGEYSGRARCV